MLLAARREAMIDLLVPIYKDPETTGGIDIFGESWDHPGSKDRIAALNWIVDDGFEIPIRKEISPPTLDGNGNGDGDGDNNQTNYTSANAVDSFYEDEIFMVRQRYVMALLFFAMNGEGWDDQFNFLQPSDVCQWTSFHSLKGKNTELTVVEPLDFVDKGIFCNDRYRVSSLVMCK